MPLWQVSIVYSLGGRIRCHQKKNVCDRCVCVFGGGGGVWLVVTATDQATLFLAHHNTIMLFSLLPNKLSITTYYSQTSLNAPHASILL